MWRATFFPPLPSPSIIHHLSYVGFMPSHPPARKLGNDARRPPFGRAADEHTTGGKSGRWASASIREVFCSRQAANTVLVVQPCSATSPEQRECLFVTCFHLELKQTNKQKTSSAKGSIPNSSWLSDEGFIVNQVCFSAQGSPPHCSIGFSLNLLWLKARVLKFILNCHPILTLQTLFNIAQAQSPPQPPPWF